MSIDIIVCHSKKKNGFTLLEVLIAMVILAVGLLGIAALQTTSLKNNQSAYNRSQATLLAYDIADKMRTNVAGANNYLSSFMASTAATKQNDCLVISTTCTVADMAQNDLYDWNRAINSSLPNGTGTISLSGSIFTIVVRWDENRDGTNDSSDPSFQITFEL